MKNRNVLCVADIQLYGPHLLVCREKIEHVREQEREHTTTVALVTRDVVYATGLNMHCCVYLEHRWLL